MTQSSSGYARPELLAEPDWLEERLDDPNVRVIDCATFDLYQKAHIKGAVGLRVNPFIKDANDSLHVMPPDQFAKLATWALGRTRRSSHTTRRAACRRAGCGGC